MLQILPRLKHLKFEGAVKEVGLMLQRDPAKMQQLTELVQNKTVTYGGVKGALETLERADFSKTPAYFRKGLSALVPSVISFLEKIGSKPEMIDMLKNLASHTGASHTGASHTGASHTHTMKKIGGRRRRQTVRKNQKGGNRIATIMTMIIFLVTICQMSSAFQQSSDVAERERQQEIENFRSSYCAQMGTCDPRQNDILSSFKNDKKVPPKQGLAKPLTPKPTFMLPPPYRGDFGVKKISESEIYEGNMKDGLFHGYGELTKDGNVYTMNFVNGTGIGEGVITYKNGDMYTGEIIDFEPHGDGVFIKDGIIYSGSFHKEGDDVVGVGRFFNKMQETEKGQFTSYNYIGEFRNFVPNGSGEKRIGYADSKTGEWTGREIVSNFKDGYAYGFGRDMQFLNRKIYKTFTEFNHDNIKRFLGFRMPGYMIDFYKISDDIFKIINDAYENDVNANIRRNNAMTIAKEFLNQRTEEEMKKIEEQNRAIEEKNLAIEEQNRAIEEQARVIEEQNRAIEEQARALQEKEKADAENKKQLEIMKLKHAIEKLEIKKQKAKEMRSTFINKILEGFVEEQRVKALEKERKIQRQLQIKEEYAKKVRRAYVEKLAEQKQQLDKEEQRKTEESLKHLKQEVDEKNLALQQQQQLDEKSLQQLKQEVAEKNLELQQKQQLYEEDKFNTTKTLKDLEKALQISEQEIVTTKKELDVVKQNLSIVKNMENSKDLELENVKQSMTKVLQQEIAQRKREFEHFNTTYAKNIQELNEENALLRAAESSVQVTRSQPSVPNELQGKVIYAADNIAFPLLIVIFAALYAYKKNASRIQFIKDTEGDYEQKLSKNEEEFDAIDTVVDDDKNFDSRVYKYNGMIELLTERLGFMEMQLAYYTMYDEKEKMSAMGEKVRSTETLLDDVKRKNSTFVKLEISKRDERIALLEEEIASLKEDKKLEISKRDEQIALLEEEKKAIVDQYKDSTKKFQSQKKDLDVLVDNLYEKLISSNTTASSLQNDILTLKKTLLKEQEEHKTDIKHLTTDVQKLRTTNLKNLSNIRNLERNIGDARSDLSKKTQQYQFKVATMKGLLQKLKQELEEKDMATEKIDSMREAHRKEIEKLKKEIEEMEIVLQAKIKEQDREISELNDKVLREKQEVERQRKELESKPGPSAAGPSENKKSLAKPNILNLFGDQRKKQGDEKARETDNTTSDEIVIPDPDDSFDNTYLDVYKMFYLKQISNDPYTFQKTEKGKSLYNQIMLELKKPPYSMTFPSDIIRDVGLQIYDQVDKSIIKTKENQKTKAADAILDPEILTKIKELFKKNMKVEIEGETPETKRIRNFLKINQTVKADNMFNNSYLQERYINQAYNDLIDETNIDFNKYKFKRLYELVQEGKSYTADRKPTNPYESLLDSIHNVLLSETNKDIKNLKKEIEELEQKEKTETDEKKLQEIRENITFAKDALEKSKTISFTQEEITAFKKAYTSGSLKTLYSKNEDDSSTNAASSGASTSTSCETMIGNDKKNDPTLSYHKIYELQKCLFYAIAVEKDEMKKNELVERKEGLLEIMFSKFKDEKLEELKKYNNILKKTASTQNEIIEQLGAKKARTEILTDIMNYKLENDLRSINTFVKSMLDQQAIKERDEKKKVLDEANRIKKLDTRNKYARDFIQRNPDTGKAYLDSLSGTKLNKNLGDFEIKFPHEDRDAFWNSYLGESYENWLQKRRQIQGENRINAIEALLSDINTSGTRSDRDINQRREIEVRMADLKKPSSTLNFSGKSLPTADELELNKKLHNFQLNEDGKFINEDGKIVNVIGEDPITQEGGNRKTKKKRHRHILPKHKRKSKRV